MYRWCCVAVVFLLISGCSSSNKDVANNGHYDEDGYMGLTSANPSLVATPNSHTYARDIEAMKRALREVPNIRTTTIMIDGGFANVHIHVMRGLTDEKVNIVLEQAKRKLAEMSPQYYTIRVTVDQ